MVESRIPRLPGAKGEGWLGHSYSSKSLCRIDLIAVTWRTLFGHVSVGTKLQLTFEAELNRMNFSPFLGRLWNTQLSNGLNWKAPALTSGAASMSGNSQSVSAEWLCLALPPIEIDTTCTKPTKPPAELPHTVSYKYWSWSCSSCSCWSCCFDQCIAMAVSTTTQWTRRLATSLAFGCASKDCYRERNVYGEASCCR